MISLLHFLLNFIKSSFFVFLISIFHTVLYLFIEARLLIPNCVKMIIYILTFLFCCLLNFLVGKHLIRKTPLLLISTFFLPCLLIALLFIAAYILEIDTFLMILQYPGFLVMEAFPGESAQQAYGLTAAFYVILSFSVYLGSKFKKVLNKVG